MFVIKRAEARIGGDMRIACRVVVAWLAVLTCGGVTVRTPTRGQEQENQVASQPRPELALGRSAEYDYDPPVPGTYRLPAIKPAADGLVLRWDGKTTKLGECLKGHITVLSFIYTRCADPRACPYATGVLFKLHSISEQDPVIAENLRLITFSFDPDHDTPKTMADYSLALRQPSGSDWLFLTTASTKDLTPILSAYGQQVDRRKDPQHALGPYSHLLRVYLIDRQGMIRNVYSSGLLDPRLVLTDVRTLLIEEGVARSDTE